MERSFVQHLVVNALGHSTQFCARVAFMIFAKKLRTECVVVIFINAFLIHMVMNVFHHQPIGVGFLLKGSVLLSEIQADASIVKIPANLIISLT